MMTKAPRKEEERREPKAERRKTRSGLKGWGGVRNGEVLSDDEEAESRQRCYPDSLLEERTRPQEDGRYKVQGHVHRSGCGGTWHGVVV
jgi:hypothetical protein